MSSRHGEPVGRMNEVLSARTSGTPHKAAFARPAAMADNAPLIRPTLHVRREVIRYINEYPAQCPPAGALLTPSVSD
jgi:hypothetical protein